MLGALEGEREEVEERGEAAERGEVAERGGGQVSLPVYLGTLCFQILQTTPSFPEYVAAPVGGAVLWFAGVVGLRAQQEI